MLIIGSVAARYWIPTFRSPVDLDVWIQPDDFQKWYESNLARIINFRPQKNPNKFFAQYRQPDDTILTIEILLLAPHQPQYLFWQAQRHQHRLTIAGGEWLVASPRTLLKLKRSHLEFPLRWEKHIRDYSELQKYCDHQPDEHQDTTLLAEAYQQLYQSTKIKWGTKRVNLNMSNDAFFDKSEKAVRRIYDHDAIHRAIKFYDRPMFEKIKDDLSSAACSRRLWDALSHIEKINCVREETMVIALERRILPKILKNEPMDAGEAYAWALRRICTNLTSGWFRDFALNNWVECSHLDFDILQRFNQNYEN